MPRCARVDVGGEVYHVINRAIARMQIFSTPKEYQLFETLLFDTQELVDMRILAYVIMPNHWHLVLYPKHDNDLRLFMHRLTNAHTRRIHTRNKTVGLGPVYQGRYKSFLVDSDAYLFTLIKYVERNPVRAKLVKRCEDWQWGSAWRRISGTPKQKKSLDGASFGLPKKYRIWINTIDKEDDVERIHRSVHKGMPYGRDAWVQKVARAYNIESTLHDPGRKRKTL